MIPVTSSLLLFKNDEINYFVPSFGVHTLDQMCPGEAYAVFLNGEDDVDFMFPIGGALAGINNNDSIVDLDIAQYIAKTRTNDVALTGESHLIALTQIDGNVHDGDQLRAYANDVLVGSINIVSEHLEGIHPIDLTY